MSRKLRNYLQELKDEDIEDKTTYSAGDRQKTKTIEEQKIAQKKGGCAEAEPHADKEDGVERGKTLKMKPSQAKELKTVMESQNTAHTSESSDRWEVVSKRMPRI